MALPTIRFYRGASGVSLPSRRNGAIFVVQNDKTEDADQHLYYGDIYVDVENGDRLHITPNDSVLFRCFEDLFKAPAEKKEKSILGKVYIVYHEDNSIAPSIRVGDGEANVIDLKPYSGVTEEQVEEWTQHVTAYAEQNASNSLEYTLYLLHKRDTATNGIGG